MKGLFKKLTAFAIYSKLVLPKDKNVRKKRQTL